MTQPQARFRANWRFGIAYNAALKLCAILLHASGYRPERELNHFRTLAALPEILGQARTADAKYLDACRKKRNAVEYDLAGLTSEKEAAELLDFANQLRIDGVGVAQSTASRIPLDEVLRTSP